MSTPFRINEVLLIAGHAFEPFRCVAWAPQDGNGELSLTVIDRSNTRIGRKQIPSSAYSNSAQLKSLLEEVRAELSQEGYTLQSWTMPERARMACVALAVTADKIQSLPHDA